MFFLRVRGYESAKDQYVQLTEAELDSLETESSNNIELKEFIPLSNIDPVYFESVYYVGAAYLHGMKMQSQFPCRQLAFYPLQVSFPGYWIPQHGHPGEFRNGFLEQL
jgi:Ku70/Ku80 beta-barrel domain